MGGADDDLRVLVDAAREGDNVAVRELVLRTQPTIWRLCRALGSDGDEDDLVQETYLRALQSLRSYRGEAPVAAWLATIARRVCADHVRKRVRQRRLIGALSSLADEDWMPAPDNPTRATVASIDPERRDAFLLTQFAGFSYDEAALVLHCPIGTIRSRVARARADLAAQVRAAEAS